VKFGRKPKLSLYQRAEAIKRRAGGETKKGAPDSTRGAPCLAHRLWAVTSGQEQRLVPNVPLPGYRLITGWPAASITASSAGLAWVYSK
jgi:hypothetical protein